MRSELLSAALQMTSSRQSPRISALSAGVALVPLFDNAPPAVRSRTSVPDVQSHLLIQMSSRISRSRSASHHGEVHRRGRGPGGLAVDVEQTRGGRTPEFVPAVPRIDVGGKSASDVAAGQQAPQDFTGSRVVHRHPWSAERDSLPFIFVDAEHLEARPAGIQIAHVQRVAVAQPRREEPRPIIVDDHGSIDDLVASVAVDVRDREVVVAHSGKR
jgi:hypothetical protein